MALFLDPKTGLIVMMWLTISFFFVEIVVGYITNSMALVADSFHMLGDVAALVISFLSVKVSFFVCILPSTRDLKHYILFLVCQLSFITANVPILIL